MWNAAHIATLAWGALSFGAVYPWAYWPLIVGSITVGAVGWGVSRRRPTTGPSRRLVIALAVAVVSAGVQIVPFSGSTLTWLSPSGDLFFGPESVLGIRPALSLEPLSTAVSAVWLASLTVLFVGYVHWFESDGVQDITRGVIVVGVVLALAGIVFEPTRSETIYGFWEPRFGTGGFGPFVNENHFAGWMMMALPLAVGYFSAGVSSVMRGVRPDWRSRVLWFSSPDANTLLLVGLSAVMMGLALVLTFSRAGITCFALALLLSGWFIYRGQVAGTRRSLGLAYVVVVALVGIGWAGVDAVAREFGTTSWASVSGRLVAWQQGLKIMSDFALTGTGMNTYGTATLLYPPDTGERFIHAHNDYIQIFAEGGLLVGLPLIVAASVFACDVARRFRSGDDDETTHWIRTGAVTGLAAIALQELVDFSLQMPGNLVLFTVLCAIAVHHPRATGPRDEDYKRRSHYERIEADFSTRSVDRHRQPGPGR